jgi:hypothetical protein
LSLASVATRSFFWTSTKSLEKYIWMGRRATRVAKPMRADQPRS